MLDRNQRETLSNFVLSQLPANPSISSIAIFVGDDIARELPALPRLRDISVWMISETLRQPTPDPLIKLIAAVDNGEPALASIVEFANRIADDMQVWLDWLNLRNTDGATGDDPLHVDDGGPFIDRGTFRGFLPRVGATDTPNCILVEGSVGSGKSYLHEYLKRLSAQRENFKVGFTAIGSSNARSMTPAVASLDIGLGLKTDMGKRPRTHEDPHRYARNLVTWITEDTPERPVPAMAVFDGFDADGISSPMRTFIEGLIHSVQDDEFARRRLRVLLLGYDGARLERENLEFQRYPLEYLDSTHIESWLERRFPNQARFRYEDAASFVEDQLPRSGELRLRQLCSLVRVVMNQFSESN